MKEFDKHMETINACRFCPMCRNTCAVGEAEHRETVTPKGKAMTLFTVLNGLQPFNSEVAETMYHCILCHLCLETCEGSWDITGPVLEARRKSVRSGLEPESVRQIKDSVLSEGNPFGEKRKDRFASVPIPRKDEKATVLYFVGCGAAYSQPEIACAAIDILNASGEKYTVLEDEECCGAYLDIMGYREEARTLARKNVERFEASGCSVLVLGCPHCYYTVKEMYAQWGVKLPPGLRVVHSTQYIKELLGQQRFNLSPLEAKVTYQDPCRLGRYCGIYDEPREILKSFEGLDLVEMKWNREKARCCGYGSGMALTYPEVADEIALKRMDEARETGAEILVTACQSCKKAFNSQVLDDEKLKVADLMELVAEHLR